MELGVGFAAFLLELAGHHTLAMWARDGQPHYQIADLPTFKKPQQPPRTVEDRVIVWKKLYSV
jgi:hypothetical protein